MLLFYSGLCYFLGTVMSLEIENTEVQQCISPLSHNQTVNRLFEGYSIDALKVVDEILSPTIFGCSKFCNSSSLYCRGFSYSYSIGKCVISNAVNLKYHLIKEIYAVSVLILPIYCQENATGVIHENIIESERSSTGWQSSFHNLSCLESKERCNDPLCDISTRKFTIFCKDYPCRDQDEAVIVDKTGLYTFSILGNYLAIHVEVDENSYAWLHIQRRFDGSVNFFRDRNAYKNGFGNVSHEFWLGNDIIHELTKAGNAMIRFELFDGEEWKYAEYNHFEVADKTQFYQATAKRYSGNAGNSFGIHNGKNFSTKDNDNDRSSRNCAQHLNGAWWYSNCIDSDLNGLYLNGETNQHGKGIVWEEWKGAYFSLLGTIMKIRYR